MSEEHRSDLEAKKLASFSPSNIGLGTFHPGQGGNRTCNLLKIESRESGERKGALTSE